MASEKVETVVAGNYLEMEREEEGSKSTTSKLSRLFWHGGSVYDAWFSCASNQALAITALIICFFFFSYRSKLKPSFGVAIKGLMMIFLVCCWISFHIGCTSATDTTIFLFTTGDVIWDHISAFLWTDGKLDCLPYQCPLC